MAEQTATRRAPRRTRGKPNDVDRHVGRRIRLRRTLIGLSQTDLAEALGVTFQQVQKYERGANRIGAGRLHQLAEALGVEVGYFFEDLDQQPNEAAGATASTASAELSRTALKIARESHALTREQQRAVLAFLKTLSAARTELQDAA